MRVIGDLHGKFWHYFRLRKRSVASVQLGDFGAGFVQLPKPRPGHFWLRGNHDDPKIAGKREDCLWAYGTVPGHDDFWYMSGANSTDRAQRIAGLDWWPDEVLSYEVLFVGGEHYLRCKPRVVFSHCAPHSIEKLMGMDGRIGATQVLFDGLLEKHRPRYWLFGHYHRWFNEEINGTRFICVPPNQYIDIV